MSSKELESKVQDFRELKQMMEELTGELEAVETEIKAEMTTRGADEMQVGLFKVRWQEIVSQRLDTKLFKAHHADLFNQYTKAVTSRRFTVA